MSNSLCLLLLIVVSSVNAVEDSVESGRYYGIPLGPLSTLQHGVKGSVFIVDSKRLRIREFSYDGKGPAAYFWIGQKGLASASPNKDGLKVANEHNSTKPLDAYSSADVVLTLPKKILTDDVAWLSVWCQQFSIDFGHVVFPATVQVPQPEYIGEMSNPTHGLSAIDITMTDINTITISNFSIDGLQKEVYFVVGDNAGPADKYVKLPVDGKSTTPTPLGPYNGQMVVIPVGQPNSNPPVTLRNYQFFGIYSFSAGNRFARVAIPPRFLVPPFIEGQPRGAIGSGSRPNNSTPPAAFKSGPASSSSPTSSSSAPSSSSQSGADPVQDAAGSKSRLASSSAASSEKPSANGTVGSSNNSRPVAGGTGSPSSSQVSTGGSPASSTGKIGNGGSSGTAESAVVSGSVGGSGAGSSRSGSGSRAASAGNATSAAASVPTQGVQAPSGSGTGSTSGTRGEASGAAAGAGGRTNNSTAGSEIQSVKQN